MKYFKGAIGAGILILLDQITKIWAQNVLKSHRPIEIIPGVFELQYLENQGAAFGIMQNQIWFFIILTVAICSFVLYAYYKLPNTKRYYPIQITLLFLFAGAIGNFIDRIRLNYVIDFFYFKLIDFPIFNIADCYVTGSAAALIFLILFYYKENDLEIFSRSERHGRKD